MCSQRAPHLTNNCKIVTSGIIQYSRKIHHACVAVSIAATLPKYAILNQPGVGFLLLNCVSGTMTFLLLMLLINVSPKTSFKNNVTRAAGLKGEIQAFPFLRTKSGSSEVKNFWW